ncbi:MAG: hypothetical protein IRZ28_11130 [Steroidobacteraceae bacterium]|jgi:hypothetical protein|nr:hypothetical protein [Steroidobacteraceae bacterium]
MVNRRVVLQGAVAAAALPFAELAWSALQPTFAPALEHPSLYRVLFDERFEACRAFGRYARQLGYPAQAFAGDITHVWFHDLHPRWRQGPAAISGLTAHGALFCLEHLARDVRMRVIHRAEHRYAGHEPLYSWIIAPPVASRA